MKRFLIVKPSSLGDIIHAFPAVSMLARACPDAKIDWLVIPSFAPVVRYHPAVDQVILFQRREMGRFVSFPKAFLSLFSAIRQKKYDAVIDLQGLLRSALISRMAKTSTVAGPSESKEPVSTIFYRQKLHPGEKNTHAVWKNISMMAEFLNLPQPEKPLFEMKANPDAAKKTAALLRGISGEKFIAVTPGARWLSKQWPPGFFTECINLFTKKHPEFYVVLLGSASEKRQGEEMARSLQVPVLNLIGQTDIPGLVECIRKASLMFCNDSGPMHIAAALDIPLVAFFGPTDPVLTGPFSDRAKVLVPDLDCLKCFRRTCEDPKCHTAITAQDAVAEAEKRLKLS